MRVGSIVCSLAILAIVVMLSPQALRAQNNELPKVSLPPPLPPLPGMLAAPAQPVKATEVPKLPQLKTIPEIPPAKQVAAGTPTEKGWVDKLKSVFARFGDKESSPTPQTTQTVLKPTLKPVTETAGTSLPSPKIILPPPAIESPVMDALNLGSETPTVDPNIFAFDEEEKKISKKTEQKIKASEPAIVLPLPPKAKKDSTEQVTVPVLPNPIKPEKFALDVPKPPAVAKNIAAPKERGQMDSLQEKPSVVPPVTLPSIAIKIPPAKESVAAPKDKAFVPPPLPKPQIAAAKNPPAEKSWLDTLKDKAKNASDAITAKTQSTKASADSEKGWLDKIKDMAMGQDQDKNEAKFLKPQPGITVAAKNPPPPSLPAPPLPKTTETAANKVPALPAIPEIKLPPIASVADAKKPPVLPEIKLPKPETPEVAQKAPLIPDIFSLPPPKPVVAAENKASALPAIPEIKLPPIASVADAKKPPVLPEIKLPKPETPEVAQKAPLIPDIFSLPPPKPVVAAENKAPALPAIPEIKPLPKPETPEVAQKAPLIPDIFSLPPPKPVVAAENKAPALPAIPEIKLPPIASVADAKKPPAIPEIKPLPKPETPAVAQKAPLIPAMPAPASTPAPLPPLALGDLKLPGETTAAPPPLPALMKPVADAKPDVKKPQAIIPPVEVAAAPEPDSTPEKEDSTFEFDALNDKGKKNAVRKSDEPVIGDISQEDPAFKFWKGHNFQTQVLPEIINRKEYETRNVHLPKAVYREDLEQLLFVAIGRGDLNAIRALLNNGVNIEAKNAIGDTPLVHAAVNGQAGAVRVLLARGANPNNPNVHGMTAMQVSAERGREDIIDALFEMGAKATADYRNPLTPLQSGVTRGYASIYNAMLDGENPRKKQMDSRNRALQALADAGPNPRLVISQGMPGLSKQIIDDQSKKMPGEPLTFEEIERKLAYQEYVRKTGDDPARNAAQESTLPKLISPAGSKATPVPIPYASPQPQGPQNPPPPPGYIPPQQQEPIVGLPKEVR